MPTTEEQDDRKQEMHRFGCGHTRRATRRTIRLHPDRCSECRRQDADAAAPERRRVRRAELRAEAARLGPRPKPTPEQRAAQRVIVALVQPRTGRVYLDRPTMDLRFEERRNDWGPSLQEVSRHLDVLGVSHQAVVQAQLPSVSRLDAWVELAVRFEDRPALLVWVPSLARMIERAEA